MKLVKMSLVATMLMGASAFAIDNFKVSGDAKLYYSTQDDGDNDLLDKKGALGQAAFGIGASADLTSGMSAGTHLTAVSTLGLQGQLVDGVWVSPNGVDDYFWFDEAWLAGTLGKTTAKAGRMALDTPLVFTETWSIAKNTFEAAVLINSDIPDTTLVAAYVGGHNGGTVFDRAVLAPVNANGTTNFSQFYEGAYAFGIINNSFKPLTLQGWYYDATRVITAYWLQADLNIEGVIVGAQYTAQQVQDATVQDADSQDAYALKLGYDADTFAITGAYSATGDKGPINVGANLAASGQSKLYTEAWWYYGIISKVDTTTFKITATATAADYDFGIYYTQAEVGVDDDAFTEATFEVAKTFGPLDVGLYYIYTKYDVDNDGDAYNTLQAYLTYNF
jgi:hypothetical protein